MRSRWRIWLLACLGAGFILALGSIASAQPSEGDPSGIDVAPHGGYSSATNQCLQCHDVHAATGDYALMAQSSVNAVCMTCHTATSPTAPGSGPGSGTIGTASVRAVYTESGGGEHTQGTNSVDGNTMTQSEWSYPGPPSANATTAAGTGTSDASGGLYCASCHTPHGTFGQVVNDWTKASDEGTSIYIDSGSPPTWSQVWLDYDEANDAWAFCALSGDVITTSTGTDSCMSASTAGATWATVSDAAGVSKYLFAYNLLTPGPNHQYSPGEATFRTLNDGTDVYDWCATCHTGKSDTAHNHYTTCYACHGNPSADSASDDFPHSSTFSTLLKEYPDGLCLNCHTSGSLP
ncbi:MAG: hypothetical protein GWP04_05210 [Gammaproteobacteria bacterium]|nr:hypothetical protein [Gammaproteobacteria bacterium]